MTKPRKDLTGMTFGKLTVIKQAEDYVSPKGKHNTQWLCQCECEDKNIVIVRDSCLKEGCQLSCGCLRKENGIKLIKFAYEAIKKPLKDNPTLELNLVDEDHEPFGKFRCYNNDSAVVYFSMRDYEKIKNYNWYISCSGDNQSLRVKTKNAMAMHRLLGMYNADHINRNPLDNRRENLDDEATVVDQIHNQNLRHDNKTGVKGVQYEKRNTNKPWRARLRHYGLMVLDMRFSDKEDAIIARLNAEIQYLDKRAWQKELMVQYGLIQEEVS